MSNQKFVHTYTRKEALANRQLFDVTEMGRTVGFSVPVAVSKSVFRFGMTFVDPGDSQRLSFFLHDVVFAAYASSQLGPV